MTFRAPLAVVLAGLVALLPLLPREHVHAVAHEGGRPTTVAHRHAAPHRHDRPTGAPGSPHQQAVQAPSHQHPHQHHAATAHVRAAHAHSTGHAAHVPVQDAARWPPHAPADPRPAAHASRTVPANDPSIDDEASVVSELSSAFAAPEERLLHAPAALARVFVAQTEGGPASLSASPFVERLIHGPPSSPTSSRPPPSQAHL